VSRLVEFLAPKAIAIVGCPGDLSRPGAQPLLHLLRHGFAGALYPVNPRHARIGGLPAFPLLRERPLAARHGLDRAPARAARRHPGRGGVRGATDRLFP
jgi:hypothetical protein